MADDSPYNERYIKGKQEVARRFRGTHHGPSGSDRLPPGQHVLSDPHLFPVLDLGVKPWFDPKTWRLKVRGLVAQPQEWTYEDFQKLPHVDRALDFHCVTRWSKFDVSWRGVLFREMVERVKPLPEAAYVIQGGMDGYTTNVPLAEMLDDDCLVADMLDGKPLPREHGWPARVIHPKLYGWKGAKFLDEIAFVAKDEPGFWETRGYHNHGDPWTEERYS